MTKKPKPSKNNVYGKTCTLESGGLALFRRIGIRVNERVKQEGILFLLSLPSGSIPCAFFDPQYRGVLDKMNYGNEGVSRQMERSALTQMDEKTICRFIRELDRVLVPSGHLFLWVDKFHLLEGFQKWFNRTELNIVDHITWSKDRIGMGYRTRRVAEHLIVLQKTPKRAKGVWCNHSIPDVWIEKVTRTHAHAKPIRLQAALISAVTRPEDIVLDPAAGSFSVMKSAHTVGRNFIGCDLVVVEDGGNI